MKKKIKKGEGTFLKYRSKTCHSLDDYKKKKTITDKSVKLIVDILNK